MGENDLELAKQNIADLQKNQALTDLKLDTINQSILEIKNNHLLHINDQLMKFNVAIADLSTKFNDKVGEIYSKISDLKINDAKQEPTNTIVMDTIKYIILAVLGFGIGLLFKQK